MLHPNKEGQLAMMNDYLSGPEYSSESFAARVCDQEGCDFCGSVLVSVDSYRRDMVVRWTCPTCGYEHEDLIDYEDLRDYSEADSF